MNTLVSRSIILVSFLPVFLGSCSSPKVRPVEQDQIHLAVNYQNFPKPVSLGEVIRLFRMVPLETSDSCMIGRIAQIDQVGDLIFIQVMDNTQGLYVFNSSGVFIRQIGHFGKGPGEHTELVSFTFNRELTRIFLTAPAQKKIIEFTLAGQWVQDIKIDHPFSDLCFLNDSVYVATNMSKYFITLGNLRSHQRVDTLKRYAGSFRYGGQILYPSIDDGVLFGTSFLDTIFYIRPDQVIPRVTIDFHPNNVTKENFQGGRLPFPFPPDLIWTDGPYFESDKWFYFGCSCEHKSGEYQGKYGRKYFLFNKATGVLNHLATDDILFFGTHSFYNLTRTREFVSYIDPVYLLEKKAQILANKAFNYPAEFFQQLEKIREEDNPVLLFCTLK
ncbi:MAG TPA: hypothetical protein DC042_07900 [Bacteroidales bacterium]|nr:hypothetical protein [Bacteroidales bacterium]